MKKAPNPRACYGNYKPPKGSMVKNDTQDKRSGHVHSQHEIAAGRTLTEAWSEENVGGTTKDYSNGTNK